MFRYFQINTVHLKYIVSSATNAPPRSDWIQKIDLFNILVGYKCVFVITKNNFIPSKKK